MKTRAFKTCGNVEQTVTPAIKARPPCSFALLTMRTGAKSASGLVSALLMSVALIAGAGETADEVIPNLKLGTLVLTNAVAIEVNPVEIHFRGEGFVYKRVKRQDLPDNLKDKYPYDAAAVEKYEKEKVEKEKALQEQLRRESLAGLLRREKNLQTQIAQKTEEVARVQREINSWRARPRGGGKKRALNQLEQTKLNLNQHIDSLRDQLKTVRTLLEKHR